MGRYAFERGEDESEDGSNPRVCYKIDGITVKGDPIERPEIFEQFLSVFARHARAEAI